MTSKLNVALICKLRGSLVCLAYSFGMFAMGVCTTRQWQTAGRLVQEFNVCTVCYSKQNPGFNKGVTVDVYIFRENILGDVMIFHVFCLF